MDTFVQAVVMGIVQGLTEFLPISSSGHLIIVPFLFGWTDPFITSLAFSVMLHIGTLAALLVYFRADWLRLVPAGFAAIRDRSFRGDPDRRLAWLLVAATIPAAIAGFLLNDVIETAFRDVGLGRGHARRRRRRSCGWPTAGAAGPRASRTSRSRSPCGIGAAQALALIPGISRSGISHLGGALRRARPRGRRPVLVPDGHPDHRRRGALRGRASWSPARPASTVSLGPLVVGHGRGVRGRAWSPSASCCATCGRAR